MRRLPYSFWCVSVVFLHKALKIMTVMVVVATPSSWLTIMTAIKCFWRWIVDDTMATSFVRLLFSRGSSPASLVCKSIKDEAQVPSSGSFIFGCRILDTGINTMTSLCRLLRVSETFLKNASFLRVLYGSQWFTVKQLPNPRVTPFVHYHHLDTSQSTSSLHFGS